MEAAWDDIEALFAEALTREEPERHAWLRAACPDPEVRREVEGMLAAHAQPLGIEPRLLAEAASARADVPPGTHVGPYRLLKPLGVGGMGSVWLAEHADGILDRKVAVKLVRLPHTAEEAHTLRRRFEAERRILARLEHPGIVRLLEAGTATSIEGAEGGYPYFAMDYVSGVPITTYADEHDLPVAERLRLFTQVCEAVHHAHQRLIVHRDLKPSNLLVTEEGGEPRVKLLDFGIARLLNDESEGATMLTETGLRPMTRAYAAPEQIRGEPATTATDVYALGVVLYELLTGCRPFAAVTPLQHEQAILTETPTRPSVSLGEAGPRAAPIEPHQLRGDLDAIVLTALRKEPDARYASVEAYAADVRRHLAGLPVTARVPSLGYRLRTFVRRHRTGVAVAVSTLVLLVAFTIALAVQQRATARERDTAQATAGFLEGLFGAADPLAGERQDTLRITDLLARGVERARLELADEPLVRARLLHVIGRSYVRLAAQTQAADPLTEAIVLARAEGDLATLASSLTELAAVRQAQWRLDEAEALVREAFGLAKGLGDHDLTARAELVLALTLLNVGRPGEAEALLQTSLAQQRRQPGSDATAILMAEQALARALLDQGRLDEAEALLLALHERYTHRFGADDARLIGVLNPLTFLYLAVGRLDEAEAMGAKVMALVRDVQPGSSALSQTLATYAAVLRRQGRLDEAETLLNEALSLPSVRLGSHAIPAGTLASVRHEKGDLDGAIAAQRHSLGLLLEDTTAAVDLASLSFSRIKLANFLIEAGRFAEAEEMLLVVEGEQEPGVGSHGSRRVVAVLTDLYDRWGRPEEAERWRARLDD